jgi:hypothetical protein
MSEKVSVRRHPDLAQAQQLIQDAMDRISAAQQANERQRADTPPRPS